MRVLLRFNGALSSMSIVLALVTAPAAAQAEEKPASEKAMALLDHIDASCDIVGKRRPISDSVSMADLMGDGTTIELHKVRFMTFDAQFYREPDGTMTTAALSTKSKSFRLPWGLKMGQTRTRVHSILSMPTRSEARSSVYTVSGTNSSVTFQFKQNKLVQVGWSYDLH